MIGYVDNENFNILCSLVVNFGENAWQMRFESGRFGDSCLRTKEFEKRIRQKGQHYSYYLEFLKCRKWRNIYCEKIYNYFYVDASEFANNLANYLTSERKEKYIVSTHIRRISNNDVSFLLVHSENVIDFTNFEEDKSIHLINAWLTNYDTSNKVNLVNPFVSVEVNGNKLFASTKVFAYLRCLGGSGYYDCNEFIENKYSENVHNDVVSAYNRDKSVEEFASKRGAEIANSLKIDLNSFPAFDRISKVFSDLIMGCKEKNLMELYRVFRNDVTGYKELADVETMYYLENKHLFEFK